MEVKLKAEKRDENGKGPARRLRAAGKVPAVLYGPDLAPQPVAVDAQDLWHALHTDAGTNVLIDLQLDGDEYLTMPREIQRDILRGSLMHVDFLRIRKDVAIQVDVPVHLVGESRGVKEGGVIEHHLWEVRVECLPMAVPESLDVDITDVGINESVPVSALRIPEGVTLLTAPEEVVAAIIPPPVMAEPVTAEEAAAAEGEAEGTEDSPAAAEEGGGSEEA